MNRDDLPERWCDDSTVPEDLRRVGEVLNSLAEPAPELARTRIWARLEQRTENRHRDRRYAAMAIAAATVATVFGVLVLGPTQPELEFARVEGLIGGVLVFDTTGNRAPQVGDPLARSSRILTSARGRVVVTLNGVATTVLSESTEATIDTDGIDLHSGTVAVAVSPRPREVPFHVAAGAYTARVMGTLFVVSRTDDRVDVSVQEGKVEVIGAKTKVAIKAGHSFSSNESKAPSTVPQPLDSTAPAPAKTAAQRHPFVRESDRPESTTPPAADVTPTNDLDLLSAPDRRPVALRSDKRAIALFDDLSAAGGIDAELTAYQAARLAKADDLDAAIGRYERLLRRFPAGLFAHEARLDIIECTMERGSMDATWEHVEAFLLHYPDSERVGEVRFIRGELLRQWKGDCAAALDDYRAAQSSPRRSEDALFFSAWCQLHIGDLDEAAISLRTYLRKFPRGRHAADARSRLDELRSK